MWRVCLQLFTTTRQQSTISFWYLHDFFLFFLLHFMMTDAITFFLFIVSYTSCTVLFGDIDGPTI